MKNIDEIQGILNVLSAEERMSWILKNYNQQRIVLASSFGAEDQVLTHMSANISPDVRIFTLDTGRQFQETYDTFQKTRIKYNVSIEVYAPSGEDIQALVGQDGPNAMYESIQKRKECCMVRKIKPLQQVLQTADAWICGIRQEQNVSRYNTNVVELDTSHNILKFSPIFDWSQKDVWDYIHTNEIPYNSLHDKGFLSIGCAPCTRAVNSGESERAGRWWWEASEQKECGLHKRGSSKEQ